MTLVFGIKIHPTNPPGYAPDVDIFCIEPFHTTHPRVIMSLMNHEQGHTIMKMRSAQPNKHMQCNVFYSCQSNLLFAARLILNVKLSPDLRSSSTVSSRLLPVRPWPLMLSRTSPSNSAPVLSGVGSNINNNNYILTDEAE